MLEQPALSGAETKKYSWILPQKQDINIKTIEIALVAIITN